MSQKKKKNLPLPRIHSHSRTDTLFAMGVVCILELNSSARRGFPDHHPFLLLPQLCLWMIWWGFFFSSICFSGTFCCLLVWFLVFCKPRTRVFSANSGDRAQDSKRPSASGRGLPKHHLQAPGGQQWGRAPALPSAVACAADDPAAVLNKDLIFPLPHEKGTYPLTSERRTHSIILKYNLTCPLQRGLLLRWGTSETNLFSWSLSLWRGCKCYLSFSIKNTAGGAICLAQALAPFPNAFLCRSFYVAIC